VNALSEPAAQPYAAVTSGFHPLRAAGSSRAPCALRARRDPRVEQLQLRDVAGRIPSAARWKYVPRLL